MSTQTFYILMLTISSLVHTYSLHESSEELKILKKRAEMFEKRIEMLENNKP